jgi:nucleotide-binding universal stress UspA family protein
MTESVRTVLIAIDRSQQAEQAFDWYVANLHRPENHVVLLHIPEGPNIEMSKGIRLSDGEFQKMTEKEKQETDEMTSKYQAKITATGLRAQYKTVYGKPGEAIVEAAREVNATAVVMGTRGMGTIRRTILGSVSDYVVHHADCPVIVCRN